MKTLLILSLTLAACRLSAQPPARVETVPAQNPLIRHLPPDACSIYHFNLHVLRTRLPLQELTQRIPLPQKNTDLRELAAILREPGRAGVDTMRDIFLTETDGQGRDSLRTTSLLVHLADSGRWSAFLREQVPGLRITTNGSSFTGLEKMGAAWDKDLAVLTFIRHTARTISPSGATTRAIRESRTLLRGYDDTTAIHDPLFLAGVADDADIHAWTDQGKILILALQQLLHLDHIPAYPALAAPGCGKIRTFSALRFEKGRVTLKSILCLPPGLDSLYARLTARPLPSDLLSQIPGGTLLAMVNLHFDPAAIPTLLDGLQARGRSEALLFDKGVSFETFVNGFQGDFMLTALQPPTPPDSTAATTASPLPSGIPRPDTTMPKRTPTPPRPAIYLATALRDNTAFWSWASHLKWLNPSADPSGSGRVSTRNPLSKHLPAYRIKDSLLIIGSSAKKVAAWFADSARETASGKPTSAAGGTPQTNLPTTTHAPNLTRATPTSPEINLPTLTHTPSLSSDTLIISGTTYRDPAAKAFPPRTSDAPTLRRYRESPLSGWLDLTALTASLRQRPSSERNRSLLSIISTMDLLTITAGQLNTKGQLENVMELRLLNKEENSLKSLFKLLQ